MNRRTKALHDLCSLISPRTDRNRIEAIVTDPQTPWIEIIEFANRHMLVPSLFAALHASEMLPKLDDRLLVEYLTTLYAINQERNEKILEQLEDLVGLFSERGVSPVLLKGAAALSEEYYDYLGERVMSDIDLWVPESRIRECVSLLEEREGYLPTDTRRRPWLSHQYQRIYSPQGISALEVHYHLLAEKGQIFFPNTLLEIHRRPARTLPGASVLEPTYDLYHVFLHSEYQDRMHEHRALALRGLHHAASLIHRRGDAIDWQELDSLCRRHGLERMWRDYLDLLHRLFGMEIPAHMIGDGTHYAAIITSMEELQKKSSEKKLFLEVLAHALSYRHLRYKYDLKSRKEYPVALLKHLLNQVMKYSFSPEARRRLKNYLRSYTEAKKLGDRS